MELEFKWNWAEVRWAICSPGLWKLLIAFISSHTRGWNGDDKGNFASHQLESQSLAQPGSLNDLADYGAFQSPTPHLSCPSTVVACSVQFSCSIMSESSWSHELKHARPPCPSPTPGVHPNSCPLSRWCHPAISSSVIPFSSHIQSFPASGFFQMSQLIASCGQNIEASASVLPMNIQDWFPLGWTGWISSPSKGLSRVFSNTTVQKYQFFGIQLSL